MSLFPQHHYSLPPQPNPNPNPRPKRKTHQTSTSTLSWNSLLRSQREDPLQSLHSFRFMLAAGTVPDPHTLPLALSASQSSQFHALAVKLRLLFHPFVFSSLLLSSKNNNNNNNTAAVVSWTLLLQRSDPALALHLFDQMLHSGVAPDPVALASAAKAAGRLRSVSKARRVHEVARSNGFLDEDCVLVGNSVVKMYVECGRIEEARAVFDAMKAKDLVSWTTMINGYVRNGGFNEGLKLFRAMCGEGAMPDAFAVSAVLPSCARVAARKNGKEVHGKIIRLCLDGKKNPAVGNALMDMYAKSGSVEAASKVFERMVCKDVISWTVMILGFSLHGQGEAGIELFDEMKGKGRVFPDRATFAAALLAANTACLVEEGKKFFNLINKPEVKHYALMAGLLSRGGYFIEARAFIVKNKLTRCPAVHRAVLDGCRAHRNFKLGKRIVEQLIELEPLNAENYVMLSNVYATNEKWELVKELRETIRDMGLKTKKAYSWIEIRNKVHVFGTGDVSHPRSQGIYRLLEKLLNKMREEKGYDASRGVNQYSLHDVDEERECIPCGHSEMLAIGLGLISGSSHRGGVLQVTKNLRVCWNCHDSAKFISIIVDREIVLKDPERFHHFKNGICSCRDVW